MLKFNIKQISIYSFFILGILCISCNNEDPTEGDDDETGSDYLATPKQNPGTGNIDNNNTEQKSSNQSKDKIEESNNNLNEPQIIEEDQEDNPIENKSTDKSPIEDIINENDETIDPENQNSNISDIDKNQEKDENIKNEPKIIDKKYQKYIDFAEDVKECKKIAKKWFWNRTEEENKFFSKTKDLGFNLLLKILNIVINKNDIEGFIKKLGYFENFYGLFLNKDHSNLLKSFFNEKIEFSDNYGKFLDNFFKEKDETKKYDLTCKFVQNKKQELKDLEE